MRIGVISDTHGLLRPQAVAALAGSEHILHAGDLGRPEILDALRAIAPVTAVRGNVDPPGLPLSAVMEVDGARILVVHRREDARKKSGFHMIVSGHSHQPLCETVEGVIYLNPGAAGPRRFRLPITLARVDTGVEPWRIEFVELAPAAG